MTGKRRDRLANLLICSATLSLTVCALGGFLTAEHWVTFGVVSMHFTEAANKLLTDI